MPLQWAPLRDRPLDILPLAESLLARHAAKQYRKGVRLDPGASAVLQQYPWPGNVRELDNVMQRALILQPGATIYAQDLGLTAAQQFSEKPSLMAVPQAGDPSVAPPSVPAETSPMDAFSQATAQITGNAIVAQVAESATASQSLDDAGALGDDLKQREFEIIVSTLKQERGSKKNTAERLGISPRTLRYKIARLKESGLDISMAY